MLFCQIRHDQILAVIEHDHKRIQPLSRDDLINLCNCNGFKITFISEKHVVEDNVLFTNHMAGK